MNNPFPKLTPTEQSILELMSEGYTHARIAKQLNLDKKELKTMINEIWNKIPIPWPPNVRVSVTEYAMKKKLI